MNGILALIEALAKLLTAVLGAVNEKKVEGQINETKKEVTKVHANPGQYASDHFSGTDVVRPESQVTKQ